MERLTERTAVGILVKENYEKESLKTLYSCYGEKPNSYYSNCEEGYCAMEKLADYEDLDEQGRLIKLPCKVGDTVYVIVGKNISAQKIQRATIDSEMKIEFCTKRRGFALFDIGKTVFLTESEAEAKLKELRGGEDESSNS